MNVEPLRERDVVARLVELFDCASCPFRAGTHGINARCTDDRNDCIANITGYLTGTREAPHAILPRHWETSSASDDGDGDVGADVTECAACRRLRLSLDEETPQAQGWRKARDENDNVVWVCPKCAKELKRRGQVVAPGVPPC